MITITDGEGKRECVSFSLVCVCKSFEGQFSQAEPPPLTELDEIWMVLVTVHVLRLNSRDHMEHYSLMS